MTMGCTPRLEAALVMYNRRMSWSRVSLGFVVTFLLSACSTEASQPRRPNVFAPSVTRVAVEIDYQPGAEPVTMLRNGANPFMFLTESITALFSGSPRAFEINDTPAEMGILDGVTDTRFSVEELLSLAEENRDTRSDDHQVSFYAMFLDGYYAGANGDELDVLGVSLGDTGVIAVFTQAIEDTIVGEDATPLATRGYLQQTTLLHELGHGVGLVNNGIAMATPHQDEEHGAHCDNPDCVMYWSHEAGSAALKEYIANRVATGQRVLFDDACLRDAQLAAE